MRVLIYGGGAVGLGIASCLIRPESRVDIIARAETAAVLRQEGLLRTGISGASMRGPGPSVLTTHSNKSRAGRTGPWPSSRRRGN